jgi:hypothetical protein
MPLSHEHWQLQQVADLQERATREHPQTRTLAAAVLADRNRDRLAELTSQIATAVNDINLDDRCVQKVARAVVEGRISEHSINRILGGLKHARVRGAYFLASAKFAFKNADLPWFEEQWK